MNAACLQMQRQTLQSISLKQKDIKADAKVQNNMQITDIFLKSQLPLLHLAAFSPISQNVINVTCAHIQIARLLYSCINVICDKMFHLLHSGIRALESITGEEKEEQHNRHR